MKLNTRKVSVVIGLTVILTLPVTVVSGVGSHKKSEPHVRYPVSSLEGRTQKADINKIKAAAVVPRRSDAGQEGGREP